MLFKAVSGGRLALKYWLGGLHRVHITETVHNEAPIEAILIEVTKQIRNL